MTIDEYLGHSADVLERMTIPELNEHFKDVLVFTRPELIQKVARPRTLGANIKSTRTLDILDQLRGFGVDTDEL